MSASAIVFDMDGVIIDSTDCHTEAWRRYLAEHGIRISDIAARMLGKHNDDIVREFFVNHELTAQQIFDHGARKEALYRAMIAPEFETRLVPGVREFIRRHSATPMAVATNAEQANVDFVLELAGIRDCFQVIVSGHEVERPKPWPDIYLRAAQLLHMDPCACVVFEDSETGVAAARAAGMRVAGLLTTLTHFDDVDFSIRNFLDPRVETWLSSVTVAP